MVAPSASIDDTAASLAVDLAAFVPVNVIASPDAHVKSASKSMRSWSTSAVDKPPGLTGRKSNVPGFVVHVLVVV